MSPFGRKLQRQAKDFGRKLGIKNVNDFGKKLSTFERKAVNTLDKVAPLAAIVASAATGNPEAGQSILNANQNIQQLHKSGRATARDLDRAIGARRGEEQRQANIQFGSSIGRVRDDIKAVANPLM